MSDSNQLHASYMASKRRFLEDLAGSNSELLRTHYGKALAIADACLLALTELSRCGSFINNWVDAETAKILKQAEENAARTEEQLRALSHASSADATQAKELVMSMAQAQAVALENSLSVLSAQGEFLHTACQMWFNSIDNLYEEDAALMLERLQMIIGFVGGKLPVVGDFLDVLKFASELYAARKLKARAADEHIASVERFVDTGMIWLTGIFTFVAQTGKLDQLPLTVSEQEVNDLVCRHLEEPSRRLGGQ